MQISIILMIFQHFSFPIILYPSLFSLSRLCLLLQCIFINVSVTVSISGCCLLFYSLSLGNFIYDDNLKITSSSEFPWPNFSLEFQNHLFSCFVDYCTRMSCLNQNFNLSRIANIIVPVTFSECSWHWEEFNIH